MDQDPLSQDLKSASYPSLRGRTVLITGGATGIGEKLVEAFAAQAAQVIFFDIQDEAAHALIHRLRQQERSPTRLLFLRPHRFRLPQQIPPIDPRPLRGD